MAVISNRPLKPTPAPVDKFQELLGVLKETYAERKIFFYCDGRHITNSLEWGSNVSIALGERICYSDRMQQIATVTFELLQRAARSGKTNETLTFSDCARDVPVISAVLKVFQERLLLRGFHQGNNNANTHSPLCTSTLNPLLSVVLSWELNNPYLNPKPMLQLPAPPPWGPAKLNEDRRAGKGNCTLELGGTRFSAHRLIVGSFSPVIDKMLQPGMKEDASGVVAFPEIKDLSPEALEALVGFMYLQTMDCSQFRLLDAIRLLELSDYFESPALQKVTFEHVYGVGDKLGAQEILRLCFLQTEKPFDNLQQFCEWLLRVCPGFYEGLLSAEEVPAEELVILFGVSRHFNINSLKERLKTIWDEMETKEKTAFAKAALLKQGNRSLLEEIDQLCESVVEGLPIDDPDAENFIKAYKDLHERVFSLKTRRPPLAKT